MRAENVSGKVLVLDDDPVITRLLEKALANRGYEVATGANGCEGLNILGAFEPDVILLDIRMPQMDGYTFLQEFKQRQYQHAPDIVVLSVHESMKEIFAMEGINDFIVKPFHLEQLINKIQRHVQSQKKKVLIVDDAKECVELIGEGLSSRGYIVEQAFNGLDGYQSARHARPDLMLLDVMMPKLDGYNVCRMLKYDEHYNDMPIILFSALDRQQNRSLAREVGADAFLSKPYDPDALLMTMKELLWD